MDNVFIVTAVAGATELLRRLQAKDWFASLTILAAAVIGGLAGNFHIQGIVDIASGVIAGLAASGLVTVASRVNTGTSGYQLRNKFNGR